MNVWNGVDAVPQDLAPVVGSIGKCDGVHLGHREILRRVVERARRHRLPALLVSFEPHPAVVLAPDRVPALLQTRRQKLDALADTGLSDLLILEFTPRLAALDGPAFFHELLLPSVRFESLFVGREFRFGRARGGDVAALHAIGARAGFGVHEVPPVCVDGCTVSSSAIRTALGAGRVELAARMLGRPYAVTGEVVAGAGRGRELCFPTANLRLDNELVPRPGVYVTETVALAARHASVTNVGVRPTFGGTDVTVETHLLDFDEDLYGERVEVRFHAQLRDEVRFSGPLELGDQIARDRAAALAYFSQPRLGRQ